MSSIISSPYFWIVMLSIIGSIIYIFVSQKSAASNTPGSNPIVIPTPGRPTPTPGRPTPTPSMYPTPTPSMYPTPTPSMYPTPTPSMYPTPTPSMYPTPTPWFLTPSPSMYETPSPSMYETPSPSMYETPSPSMYETPSPNMYPTSMYPTSMRPTPTPGSPTYNEIFSNIKEQFTALSTDSSNIYNELINFENNLQTNLEKSKNIYLTAYNTLNNKVQNTVVVYSNLLSNIQTLNTQSNKYNSDITSYTSSNINIPDPSDTNFVNTINDIKTKVNIFVNDGKSLVNSYNTIIQTINSTDTGSISNLIKNIQTDTVSLKSLADDYNSKTLDGQTVVQKFNDSDALKNTNLILKNVNDIINEASSYTFSTADQQVIDKIIKSLKDISTKINVLVKSISEYKIDYNTGNLLSDINSLVKNVNDTYTQVVNNIQSINANITNISKRTGNLNYALTALQKNIELNNNYNDIKSFFDSLYPAGAPKPISI